MYKNWCVIMAVTFTYLIPVFTFRFSSHCWHLSCIWSTYSCEPVFVRWRLVANKLKRKRKVTSPKWRGHDPATLFRPGLHVTVFMFMLPHPFSLDSTLKVLSPNRVVRTATVAQTTSPSPKQLGLPPPPIFFHSHSSPSFSVYKSFKHIFSTYFLSFPSHSISLIYLLI